ncbi:hypothetical protein THIOM_000330 [Candidatus Thiomargarita nelsonii]|uniref:Uncharacterized protein n=1 Tax=Candidatus Thiomargarita nelsonii TaxID=1003181 RepID=A0A176S7D0_9GAMM|nr:hypothetical protein THIOM_000330 [Candidatus Thiomargarita nelsonii]
MKAMKHAHPLPNFMLVITQHGDMLALSPEQAQALANWLDKHGPIAKELAMAIKKGEQQLQEASMNGSSKEEIMAQLEALLDKRRQLAEMKTICRDNMRQILSDEQWNEVVSLYKEML